MLPKRLIREIVYKYQLKHETSCREGNGKGRAYSCICSFFEKVHLGIKESYKQHTINLEKEVRKLSRLEEQREDKYELISKLNAEIRNLDLEIGNTKINIAIAEITS